MAIPKVRRDEKGLRVTGGNPARVRIKKSFQLPPFILFLSGMQNVLIDEDFRILSRGRVVVCAAWSVSLSEARAVLRKKKKISRLEWRIIRAEDGSGYDVCGY